MPSDITRRFHLRLRRLALVCAAVAGLVPALVAAPAVAEEPTPQAVNAHAEFLADPATPPPPAPVKVCVVDTGVDLTTDAAPAVVERYSEFGGTVDDTGGGGIAKHGTYVAGVIASQMDGVGSVGIWPRARIVSVRVFPDKDSGTTVATYLHALNRCRDRGTTVINLSLSGLASATGPELDQLANKIATMSTLNQINVVAAAGNNAAHVAYPAAFPSVLAVGASDAVDALCDFSGRGPALDISALGCGLVASLSDGSVGTANGTSYSTPVVTGVLAALRAYRPDLTATDAEQLLTASSRAAGPAPTLDASAAFRSAGLAGFIPTESKQPVVESSRSAPSPTVVRDVPPPSVVDPLQALHVRPPLVHRATYERGRLIVLVSGVPQFGRAVFAVDRRRYRRRSGALRVRLSHRPRRVAVFTEVPHVGRTRTVNVKISRPRRRR